MDFLDIISTVIEFSQKEEEFCDEVKAIRATLESLQLIIRQIDQQELPQHIRDLLTQNLQDAEELLTKVNHTTHSWWTTFKNMLPGSDLQKIKEKNQQLVRIINLLNLHLNMWKKDNKRTASSSMQHESRDLEGAHPTKKVKTRMISQGACENMLEGSVSFRKTMSSAVIRAHMETVDTVVMASSSHEEERVQSQKENHKKGGLAFKLKPLFEKRLENLARHHSDFEPAIEVYWEEKSQVSYTFNRTNFQYLPLDMMPRLSREHAAIKALRIAKQTQNMASQSEEQKSCPAREPTMFFDTGCTADAIDSVGAGETPAEKMEYEYIYTLIDLSLNGTFYVKGSSLSTPPKNSQKICQEFVPMKKNQEVQLEHGDIIGLILQAPERKELIFGFQFLMNE